MLKINVPAVNRKTVGFDSIEPQDLFEIDGEIFMKIYHCDSAISFGVYLTGSQAGETRRFGYDDQVVERQGTLTIEPLEAPVPEDLTKTFIGLLPAEIQILREKGLIHAIKAMRERLSLSTPTGVSLKQAKEICDATADCLGIEKYPSKSLTPAPTPAPPSSKDRW